MLDLNLISVVVCYLFTSIVVLINFFERIVIGLYYSSYVIHICIKGIILYIFV